MGANDAAEQTRRRREARFDLDLDGLLAEPPTPLLTVPRDLAQLGPVLDRLRRDGRTPPVVRRLLGRTVPGDPQGLAGVLAEAGARHHRAMDLLLTMLTRPQREVKLADGSIWLLAVVSGYDAQPPTDGEPFGQEPSVAERSIGWVRLRLPKAPGALDPGFIEEMDIYPYPAAVDDIREELVLLAIVSGWKPRVPGPKRQLILLGPTAALYLGGDIAELEATAAVDNVHLTAITVPRNSSSRPWVDARNRALELEGPVFSALFPEEQSGQRLLAALRLSAGAQRPISELPAPGHRGWCLDEILGQLRDAEVLSVQSVRPVVPQAGLSSSSGQLAVVSAPAKLRYESREVYLAKTGSARKFDVLVETGRRCPHTKWTTLRMHGGGGKAPKKYKGVLKYLDKLASPGRLVKAELCTFSGCGLVKVAYEVAVPGDGVLSDQPGPGAGDGGPAGGRGPPVTYQRAAHRNW
jgi:hypothetical protein